MKRALLGLLCCVAVTTVLAHAHLQKAVPADGATVTGSPANVILSFSEPARMTACWLQKGDGPMQKITSLPTAPAAQIAVPLPKLDPGPYVLSWRVVGNDSHVVPGQIRFTVAATQHQ